MTVLAGVPRARKTTYSYDAGGRKTSQEVDKVDGNGNLIGSASSPQTFSYFANDRLQTESARTSGAITSSYDAAGNRTSIQDTTTGTSTLTSTYYLDGLLRSTDDASRTNLFAYDGAGDRAARRDQVDSPQSTQDTVTYSYNDAGFPTLMSSSTFGTSNTTMSYDAAGRPATELDPNGEQTTYSFNADDTLAQMALKSSPTGTNLATWTYTYDSLYRMTSEDLSGQSASGGGNAVTGKFQFSYDDASRVKQIQPSSGPSVGITYDHDSNRTKLGNQLFTYNADDSIKTATDSNGNNSKTYSYNTFGDLVDDGFSCDDYDGFDRLTSTSPHSGGNNPCPGQITQGTTYKYDGLDRQRSRTDNQNSSTTAYHYDGLSQGIAIESQSSQADRLYELDAAGAPKAMSISGTTSYLNADAQGDVTTVTNSSAQLTCTARFDPWGTPRSPRSSTNLCNSGSTSNDIFYRGARRDAATGNYQFGSRTYDPSKADFLTPDSYRSGDPGMDLSVGTDPLTENRYSYVNGDPVNLIDPNGHCADPVACPPPPGASPDTIRRWRQIQLAADAVAMGFGTAVAVAGTQPPPPHPGILASALGFARNVTGSVISGGMRIGGAFVSGIGQGAVDLGKEGFNDAVAIDKAIFFGDASSLVTRGKALIQSLPKIAHSIAVNMNPLLYGLHVYNQIHKRGVVGGLSKLANEAGRQVPVAATALVGGELVGEAAGAADLSASVGEDTAAEAETTLYRAVSSAERVDIESFGGFRAGPNSYEGKLFATSAEDAARFGRISDALTPGGEPFHIVETRVPTSLANSFEFFTADSMQAIHVAEEQLDALNSVGSLSMWGWVPVVGKPGAGL